VKDLGLLARESLRRIAKASLLEAARLLESLRNIAGAHRTKHMDGRLIPQMCGKKFCSFAAKVVE